MPVKSNGITVNQIQLAEMFGVTSQTIREWKKKPSFPILEDGIKGKQTIYNTAEIVAWRHEQILLTVNTDGKTDMLAIRLRRETAMTELTEIELVEKRNELVPIKVVAAAIAHEYSIVRSKFLAIPGELANELEYLVPAEIEELLASKITETLDVLASDTKDEIEEETGENPQ